MDQKFLQRNRGVESCLSNVVAGLGSRMWGLESRDEVTGANLFNRVQRDVVNRYGECARRGRFEWKEKKFSLGHVELQFGNGPFKWNCQISSWRFELNDDGGEVELRERR